MRRARSILLALIWIGFGVAAWVHYRSDQRKREPSDAFVRKYQVALRRPAHAETIHFAPAADLANEVAADVALQDVTRSVNLNALEPAERQAWLDAVPRYGEELADAHALLLDAIRERPGWPFHRALLGEIEFVRRSPPDRWLIPLESARKGSPGEVSFSVFAANAIVETRRPDLVARARPIFASAMRDTQFVRTSYLDLIELLGHDAVFSLLPDDAAPLQVAIRSEAEVADVEAVTQLFPRWERAEWREREEDLRKVIERARMNDLAGLRQACTGWMAHHAPRDFDRPRGRAQLARLLDLWPDEPGSWYSDPRATLIAFFLDGRESEVDGRSLARAVSWLADVPDPIAARVALADGDLGTAEELARRSETAGSFEWTRFYVDLARHHLAAKRLADAAAALDRIAPTAQNECDVVVTRRAAAVVPPVYSGTQWSRGRLPVCVDRAGRQLASTFAVGDIPALVSYGFNDGRLGTTLLQPGRSTLTVPAPARPGRAIFFIDTVAGGDVQPTVAALR